MRRILLDTHTFLWWLADHKSLGAQAREIIANPNNQIFLSAASTWEIAIKKSKGLLQAPNNLEELAYQQGFDALPISLFHGEQTDTLPDIHRDPFDRMLVIQAQAEGLEIMTSDNEIPKYGVKVVDAGN